MTNVTQPFVTPPPKGILDPRNGRPIGADDPSFGTLNNELADKGFLVTATDELITWARSASVSHLAAISMKSDLCAEVQPWLAGVWRRWS
jgi:hypothetical protein